jgi:2-keto-4-pentenoate hydratase/2-oxohepta-3-ene-1,7-dioic acid hydratase in catechol pathway
MKIARFLESGKETFGLVKDGKIATREQITFETGIPLPFSIKDFLFDGWFDEIKEKVSKISYERNISNCTLLAPIPNPSKIICLALNYIDHAKEQDRTPPEEPVIFIKPRTSLTGTQSDIVCPSFVTKLDYEIELALVIGKNSKNIPESKAMEAIFGYMIFNDVSARDIQFKDKQFTRGKGFDTFAPCGPWITTADEISNPQNLKMITKINDEIRQNSNTSKMFLKIPSIVSKLSKVMTLEKGDIISTGTPEGVVLNNPNIKYLQDGDKIEMEIENFGTLINSVKFVNQN